MLGKRKHSLIPARFELGATCSLLKLLVWHFSSTTVIRADTGAFFSPPCGFYEGGIRIIFSLSHQPASPGFILIRFVRL